MKENSLDKIIDYLRVLTIESFTYNRYQYNLPKELKLSPTFFRDYRCPEGCGWCCPRFTLDYFQCDISEFTNRYSHYSSFLEEIKIKVNGVAKRYWSITQKDRRENTCRFLTHPGRRCSIHEANPVSCQVEPIKFIVHNGIGYIQKKPFSRGWVIRNGSKAKCIFSQPSLSAIDNDIGILSHLDDVANNFGITTYLPNVIQILQDVKISGLIPKKQITIRNINDNTNLLF